MITQICKISTSSEKKVTYRQVLSNGLHLFTSVDVILIGLPVCLHCLQGFSQHLGKIKIQSDSLCIKCNQNHRLIPEACGDVQTVNPVTEHQKNKKHNVPTLGAQWRGLERR